MCCLARSFETYERRRSNKKKVDHQMLLETGVEHIHARRETCKSWLADQGVDLALGDCPAFDGDVIDVLERLKTGDLQWDSDLVCDSYFFPKCYSTADGLHTIFNALEDAFTSSAAWPHFEPLLRDLVTTIGHKKSGIDSRLSA